MLILNNIVNLITEAWNYVQNLINKISKISPNRVLSCTPEPSSSRLMYLHHCWFRNLLLGWELNCFVTSTSIVYSDIRSPMASGISPLLYYAVRLYHTFYALASCHVTLCSDPRSPCTPLHVQIQAQTETFRSKIPNRPIRDQSGSRPIHEFGRIRE